MSDDLFLQDLKQLREAVADADQRGKAYATHMVRLTRRVIAEMDSAPVPPRGAASGTSLVCPHCGLPITVTLSAD
jgi:hypothetical protein